MWTGADTRRAACTARRRVDGHVPVKFEIDFAQHVVRTGLDAGPARLTQVGIQLDVIRLAGVMPRQVKFHGDDASLQHNAVWREFEPE